MGFIIQIIIIVTVMLIITDIDVIILGIFRGHDLIKLDVVVDHGDGFTHEIGLFLGDLVEVHAEDKESSFRVSNTQETTENVVGLFHFGGPLELREAEDLAIELDVVLFVGERAGLEKFSKLGAKS